MASQAPQTPQSFPSLSYLQAIQDSDTFVTDLRSALLNVGFFNLTDISEVLPDWQDRWDEAFEVSKEFFQLPVETKNELAMINSRHFRGYAATREEVTAGQPDWREQIDFGPESSPAVPYPPTPADTIELSLYGPNLYPSRPTSFRQTIETYRSRVSSIAENLVRLIAESLSPEPELFTKLFLQNRESRYPPYARLKVVQYPPVEPGAQGFGVGAHRDGGGLTLLAQDDSGGLQVQTWDGNWFDVTPVPYALVVNVGQVLERISAGAYPATTHRVLKTSKRSTPRVSIPYFFSPPLTTRLVPLTVEQLHPELRDHVDVDDVDDEGSSTTRRRRRPVVSEVGKGDLHSEVYGKSAWKGIKRSHSSVWNKYYSRYDIS